jgi:hypothetical protein
MLRSRQAAICCPGGARVAQLIDEERRLKTVHGNGAGPVVNEWRSFALSLALGKASALVRFLVNQ